MYESHVPIYDGGQKTHFLVFSFVFWQVRFTFYGKK